MTEYRAVPEFPRFKAGTDGSIVGPSGKILSLMVDQDGYLRASIYLGDYRWRRVGVHYLVCSAFHGSKPRDKDLVAHGDGNRKNNMPSNLRWATYEENEKDKKDHGRSLQGEGHHQHKLTEAEVLEIRRRCGDGESQKSLAKEHGVSGYAIHAVVSRKTWRHI